MNCDPYEAYLLQGEAFPASNALLLPKFDPSGEWTGVFAHEYFHFLQFTGTGAGRLVSFMMTFLGHSAGTFLHEPPPFLHELRSWRFPIRDWCEFEPHIPLRQALRKHFSHLIFEGDTLAMYLGSLIDAARGNRWNSRMTWPWSVAAPRDDVLPHVMVNGRAEYFGAFHVMESAAAIQGLRMEGPDIPLPNGGFGFELDDARRKKLMRWPIRYSVGMRYIQQHSTIPQHLIDSVTMLTADIALASHFETLMRSTTDKVKWEDWQPGWRFVKAVAALDAILLRGVNWPSNEEEFVGFCDRINDECGWTSVPNELHPLYIFHDSPSRVDRLRHDLAVEATELRRVRPSLWSIGSRQQLIDAALKWFKPPMLLEYGCDTIRVLRTDIVSDEATWGELWQEMQRTHIAWQMLRPGGVNHKVRVIECFPWAKEGSGVSCSESNGSCRWFPAPSGKCLPESCPMLGTLGRMCGNHFHRLRPLE